MNNNNYESMRAFLVIGLFVCTCAAAQAQTLTVEASKLSSSSVGSSLEPTLANVENSGGILATPTGAAQYALHVEKLESNFGPFDSRLKEPLLATSELFVESGNYQEAVSYTEQALHIIRVNDGLYSESQIAIVERLIEFNVAMEDWAAVDENFRYLEFLYTRLYELGSLKWDHGIARVADWHVIAINNNLGDDREEHLREANKLFKLRLIYAEQDESVGKHVIEVLRHNVEYTAYHLQKREDSLRTERIYSRLESRYRDDRADSVASVD